MNPTAIRRCSCHFQYPPCLSNFAFRRVFPRSQLQAREGGGGESSRERRSPPDASTMIRMLPVSESTWCLTMLEMTNDSIRPSTEPEERGGGGGGGSIQAARANRWHHAQINQPIEQQRERAE